MKILLSHTPSLPTTAIKILTASRLSHVDFILDDYTVCGSVPKLGVVQQPLKQRLDECNFAESLYIPTTLSQDEALFTWLASQLGKHYDWSALFTSFILQRDWQDDDKWFCAELVAAGFDIIGLPIVYGKRYHRITPAMLDLLPYDRTILKC